MSKNKSIDMAFSPRQQGKVLNSIYQALDTMIEHIPGRKRYVLCCLSSTYEHFKKLPESYFRGRWLYIDYKGTTTLVKKVVIKKPSGYKTIKVKRASAITPLEMKPVKVDSDFAKQIERAGEIVCLVSKIKWDEVPELDKEQAFKLLDEIALKYSSDSGLQRRISVIGKKLKDYYFLKKCFYVSKSGGVFKTDYGDENIERLKEVLL